MLAPAGRVRTRVLGALGGVLAVLAAIACSDTGAAVNNGPSGPGTCAPAGTCSTGTYQRCETTVAGACSTAALRLDNGQTFTCQTCGDCAQALVDLNRTCGTASSSGTSGTSGTSGSSGSTSGAPGDGGPATETCTNVTTCSSGNYESSCRTTTASGTCVSAAYLVAGVRFACTSCTDCAAAESQANAACVGGFDAGTDSGTTTLYQRLGGHSGIQQFMTALLTQELKDPQQASYFVYVVPNPQPGHPGAADLINCMTDLVGSATGGPEVYPSKLADGYQCRALATSHAYLHVPNGVFNDMVTTMAAVGTAAGVSASDVAKLAALFGTTRAQIVDPAVGDAGYFHD